MKRSITALFLVALLFMSGAWFAPEVSADASIENTTSTSHEQLAVDIVSENGAVIDFSYIQNGYVEVMATASARLKFQVLFGDELYTYDMPNDGSTVRFSLQGGDTRYTLRVMQNTHDNKYAPLLETTRNVNFDDPFAPYLCATQTVNYSVDSRYSAMAQKIYALCGNDTSAAKNIAKYVSGLVSYDYDSTPAPGYISDPEHTFETQKGKCLDFAVLTASMLRSTGIPAKVVYGNANGTYHAWNEVYVNGSWMRIDTVMLGAGYSFSQVEALNYEKTAEY